MKTMNHTNREGSALLIAILVMGILMTITLGLSDLIIREIRQTGDVVAAGKAYFSAEAGVENALLDLHQNLPGYETQNPSDPADKYIVLNDTPTGLDARYRILNKADKVPYFDPDRPIFLSSTDVPTNVDFVYTDHPEATYNDLPLGQSAVIPLYSEKDGVAERVDNFLIEYYVSYDQQELNLSGIPKAQFSNVDILRWKIFGKPDPALGGSPSDASKTEAISDFFPSAYDASAKTPMCIGTDQTLDPKSLYPTAKDLGCLFPVYNTDVSTSTSGGASGNLWGAARECYGSDSGNGGGVLADIQKDCFIQKFVQTHIQNYLVLTNVINPDVLLPAQLLDTPEARKKFTIHYRIVARAQAGDPKLVREAASISADGFAANGQVKQSIDVKINQSNFLPVFNFSLYHTCTKLDASNPNCPKS